MAGTDRPWRVALRGAPLDDVVVEDVEMFRAEVMDARTLWLCCYLGGTGTAGDRIAFEVRARGSHLEFRVTERPVGAVTFE